MAETQKRAASQSALRMPLNWMLGTQTNVRILRALYQLDVPIGVSELARYIKMDKSGVWRAITLLEELGTLEAVGLGQQQTVQARKESPLTRHLIDLFRAERLRFEKLFDKLSETARSLVPPAKSIWIEGRVAAECDQPGDPVVVGILAPSSDVGRLAETFRRKTTLVQKQFSVIIEVRALTTADLAVMDASEIRLLGTAILLAGIPPIVSSTAHDREHFNSHSVLHEYHDEQSLRLARAISERLRKDRTLVRRALAYVRRRLATVSPREAKELQEWRRILQTYSLPQLRKLLIDAGERGTRLRQSSPFTPILSRSERADLLQHLAHSNTSVR